MSRDGKRKSFAIDRDSENNGKTRSVVTKKIQLTLPQKRLSVGSVVCS